MNDEMYTTKQAAIYLGVTDADVRLAIREGKLRAWTMPMSRNLLVRRSDLMKLRESGRSNLTRQLPLFSADANETRTKRPADKSDTNVA
jgi:excisionase family DNA binding protein